MLFVLFLLHEGLFIVLDSWTGLARTITMRWELNRKKVQARRRRSLNSWRHKRRKWINKRKEWSFSQTWLKNRGSCWSWLQRVKEFDYRREKRRGILHRMWFKTNIHTDCVNVHCECYYQAMKVEILCRTWLWTNIHSDWGY